MNSNTPIDDRYDLLLIDWEDKDEELGLTQFDQCFCDLYGRLPDDNDTRRFLEDQERQSRIMEGHKGIATAKPESEP